MISVSLRDAEGLQEPIAVDQINGIPSMGCLFDGGLRSPLKP
jgi:hypothetical protein